MSKTAVCILPVMHIIDYHYYYIIVIFIYKVFFIFT